MKIKSIHARQIFDSRGNPTVEADVVLENGVMARSAVPSGASTGSNEACELRDNDSTKYLGKGVLKAVKNVNEIIAPALIGKEVEAQSEIDHIMIDLDGTPTKSKLGANAILAVSLACAQTAAVAGNMSLFEYVAKLSSAPRAPVLPLPLCNVINGGQHAFGSTDIQEFMIVPVGAQSFTQAMQWLTEVFHSLAKVLKSHGYGTTVGDEGGYAPAVKNGNAEALALISEAIEQAGYKLGEQFAFALDVDASELYKDGVYNLATENKKLSTDELIEYYQDLITKYPIISLEDGLAEDDWDGWQKLTEKLGSKLQLVGDDLLVTNIKFLQKAITEKSANAILIKVNQIGTLTETISAVDMAHSAGWKAIISHRSGETEDTTIAHLVVGLGTGQIKTGSVSRTDRIAKYNELLRIEEKLGDKAVFAGNQVK